MLPSFHMGDRIPLSLSPACGTRALCADCRHLFYYSSVLAKLSVSDREKPASLFRNRQEGGGSAKPKGSETGGSEDVQRNQGVVSSFYLVFYCLICRILRRFVVKADLMFPDRIQSAGSARLSSVNGRYGRQKSQKQ